MTRYYVLTASTKLVRDNNIKHGLEDYSSFAYDVRVAVFVNSIVVFLYFLFNSGANNTSIFMSFEFSWKIRRTENKRKGYILILIEQIPKHVQVQVQIY
jgi:hypothetical protein